jgi:hypothetical protein
MMSNQKNTAAREKLARLNVILHAELENAPAEEIATASAAFSGAVPNASERFANIFAAAKAHADADMLQRAKAEVVDFWSHFKARQASQTPTASNLKERLEKLLSSRPDALDGMLLAARNGDDWNPQDLEQLVEDLEILAQLEGNTEKK